MILFCSYNRLKGNLSKVGLTDVKFIIRELKGGKLELYMV